MRETMGKSEYRGSWPDSGKARRWQSGALAGALAAMLALAGCGRASTAPPAAYPPDARQAQPPGGALGTLKLGHYTCELPGDALGQAGIAVPEEDFDVMHASLYASKAGGGTYLHWGATVEMTSGPKRGERFVTITPNQLKKLNPDGSEGDLRCTRQVLNNEN